MLRFRGVKNVQRTGLEAAVAAGLRRSPAAVLLGPRQRGKTTLARKLAAGHRSEYFDLEKPGDIARLANPELMLLPLRGLVVIDEVQRRPDLFPVLRTLLDRQPVRVRFLLVGSASPELLAQTSETLAGRVAFVTMSGFSLAETGTTTSLGPWQRGGFPRAIRCRQLCVA
jgi:uncharacterized protein